VTQRKTGRGCLVALLVAAGVAGVALIAAAVAVYVIAKSPEGQKAIGALSEGVQATKESLTAPGTKELKALGCDTAMVVDVQRVTELIRKYADAGANDPDDGRLLVLCKMTGPSNAPTCADVAAAYLRAVGTPAGRLAVQVQRRNGKETVCSRLYDVDGEDLGAFR